MKENFDYSRFPEEILNKIFGYVSDINTVANTSLACSRFFGSPELEKKRLRKHIYTNLHKNKSPTLKKKYEDKVLFLDQKNNLLFVVTECSIHAYDKNNELAVAWEMFFEADQMLLKAAFGANLVCHLAKGTQNFLHIYNYENGNLVNSIELAGNDHKFIVNGNKIYQLSAEVGNIDLNVEGYLRISNRHRISSNIMDLILNEINHPESIIKAEKIKLLIRNISGEVEGKENHITISELDGSQVLLTQNQLLLVFFGSLYGSVRSYPLSSHLPECKPYDKFYPEKDASLFVKSNNIFEAEYIKNTLQISRFLIKEDSGIEKIVIANFQSDNEKGAPRFGAIEQYKRNEWIVYVLWQNGTQEFYRVRDNIKETIFTLPPISISDDPIKIEKCSAFIIQNDYILISSLLNGTHGYRNAHTLLLVVDILTKEVKNLKGIPGVFLLDKFIDINSAQLQWDEKTGTLRYVLEHKLFESCYHPISQDVTLGSTLTIKKS